MTRTIPILMQLPETARARRAWFVDIWGVMHDGVRPFTAAVSACRAFRKAGGCVVLVSNAPRPAGAVAAQLDRLGVASDCYDAIVTSGDIARELVSAYAGKTVLHVGPERDRPLFDGLDVTATSAWPSRSADNPHDLAAIVCTGLTDDERETAEDYRVRLAPMAELGVAMVCANPDLTVERGGRLIPCAGAVAAVYEGSGGPVTYAGKPYLPIYEAAQRRAEQLCGAALAKSAILAIGDGIRTDIDGAARFGIDSVFIASAVSMGDRAFGAEALADVFHSRHGPEHGQPIAAMAELRS